MNLHPGALQGTLLRGRPLVGHLPTVKDENNGLTYGILSRNNRESKEVFQMVAARGYDAAVRYNSSTTTVRQMLFTAIDVCAKLGITSLHAIEQWACAPVNRARPLPYPMSHPCTSNPR